MKAFSVQRWVYFEKSIVQLKVWVVTDWNLAKLV